MSGFGDRKASKDGENHYCLDCLKIIHSEIRAKRKKRGFVPELIPEEKYCPGCKRTLSSSSFWHNSTSSNCLDGKCIDCRKQYMVEYWTRPDVMESQRILARESYRRRKKN